MLCQQTWLCAWSVHRPVGLFCSTLAATYGKLVQDELHVQQKLMVLSFWDWVHHLLKSFECNLEHTMNCVWSAHWQTCHVSPNKCQNLCAEAPNQLEWCGPMPRAGNWCWQWWNVHAKQHHSLSQLWLTWCLWCPVCHLEHRCNHVQLSHDCMIHQHLSKLEATRLCQHLNQEWCQPGLNLSWSSCARGEIDWALWSQVHMSSFHHHQCMTCQTTWVQTAGLHELSQN